MSRFNPRRDRRVAWILNHMTLRDFEVPLIRSLGYEVWTSKQLSKEPDFASASADWSDDEHSTLPPDVLDLLNGHNFYDDPLTPEVAEALNLHFGTIITIAFQHTINDLLDGFQGRLVYRAFGREAPLNYTDLFRHYGSRKAYEKIERAGHRFWMAPCYDSIPLIEGSPVRERCVVLPLGLPQRSFDVGEIWRGDERRVLFVCPRIASHAAYYGKIYHDFKRDFGDLPHVVGGNQPRPVDDPNVTGFLPEERFLDLFRRSSAMYYHSREPRHLHYHPIEAMIYGMPVIYLRGGILESSGGEDQPGACDTVAEAREKLQRVLDGDAGFTEAVRKAQRTIAEKFTFDYCRPIWRERFANGIMATPIGDPVAAAVAG